MSVRESGVGQSVCVGDSCIGVDMRNTWVYGVNKYIIAHSNVGDGVLVNWRLCGDVWFH